VQFAVKTAVPFLVTVAGLAVSVQTGADGGTPLPFTTTTLGLPAALLFTDMELNVDMAVLGL
jgi:hypothetical protein